MKSQNIQVGDSLQLKAARGEAYGLGTNYWVTVRELKERRGYKVPFVLGTDGGVYKPSDFALKLGAPEHL